MGKVAFLYPGQGSQRVGMGIELLSQAPELFQYYLAKCDEISGLPITHYCLHGPYELLTQTHVAQPALFAYSITLAMHCQHVGLKPDFVAGHSLGEYTAAVSSGVLSFDEGLELVYQRGKLMQEMQKRSPGGMAAVMGLTIESILELCQQVSQDGQVCPANFNTADQIVISGEEAGIQAFTHRVCEMKQGRVIRLPVGGAFHTQFMQPVQIELERFSQRYSWNNAHIPLAVNISGKLCITGEHIRQALIQQITCPVQWVSCIQTLLQAGTTYFLELGPGQILVKLVRRIAPEAQLITLNSLQQIDELVSKGIIHR